MKVFVRTLLFFSGLVSAFYVNALIADENTVLDETKDTVLPLSDTPETEKVKEEYFPEEVEAPTPKPAKPSSTKKRIERANAFVVGADWEFDGFVSGGEGDDVRSMFYLGDLVYPNIGSQQGLAPGDRIGIYKRGNRVRDPQTGKMIGYEVRRAAFARVTDRVEEAICAVRISNTFEPVEIGDLVRRED